jgi:hypothetical protein
MRMQHLRFFNQKLEEEEGWKLEKKGPFGLHDRFDYLKRKMEIKEDGVTVRPDDAHIIDLEKLAELGPRDRKTPCAGMIGQSFAAPWESYCMWLLGVLIVSMWFRA